MSVIPLSSRDRRGDREGPIELAAVVLVGTFFASLAGPATAQGVGVTGFGGALDLGTDLAFQEVKSSTGDDRTFERYRFDERLEVFADGYALTREMLTFHLGGNFGLRQELLGGDDFEGENSDGTHFGYDVSVNLFPQKLVATRLFTNRFEDETVQSFGNDTSSLSQLFGGGVFVRFPIFPFRLGWQRRTSEIESRGGLFRSRRDETRDTIEFSGRHDGEALDANVRFRYEDVTDRSEPSAGGDYQVAQLSGTTRYRWGPYYEKSIRISGSYFQRERSSEFSSSGGFKNTSVSSLFLWDPLEELKLAAQHDFDWFDSADQSSVLNSVLFSANHRLYESLRSHAKFSADHENADGGTRYSVEPSAGISYRKLLPADSRVLFDFSFGYRLRDSNADPRDRRVTGEPLTLNTNGLNFLANPRVDPATIEVRQTIGGTPLEIDVDYEIPPPFGDATSIDIGSSGLLSTGDTVIVDYIYLTDPSARIGRTSMRWSLAWEHPWLALRYNHSESDETLLAGSTNGSLNDVRRDSYRIDLRGQANRVRGDLGVEYVADQTGTVDSDQWSFSTGGSFVPIPRLRLTANAQVSLRMFKDPSRDITSTTVAASASWRARRYWDLRLFSNYRRIQDSVSLPQEDVEVGLRSNIRIGRIQITPSLSVTQRERGKSGSLDMRGTLRIRRTF